MRHRLTAALVSVPPSGSTSFHTGSAFAVVSDDECYRSWDDYACGMVEPGWSMLTVTPPRTLSDSRMAGRTTGSAAGTSSGRARISDYRASTANAPSVSVATVRAGRVVADGAGALVRVQASCDSGPDTYGYGGRVRLTLRQRLSATRSVDGSIDAPAYAALPCDRLAHVMTIPVMPAGGFAFRPGRAHVTATYSASFGSPAVTREDTTQAGIVLRPEVG